MSARDQIVHFELHFSKHDERETVRGGQGAMLMVVLVHCITRYKYKT